MLLVNPPIRVLPVQCWPQVMPDMATYCYHHADAELLAAYQQFHCSHDLCQDSLAQLQHHVLREHAREWYKWCKQKDVDMLWQQKIITADLSSFIPSSQCDIQQSWHNTMQWFSPSCTTFADEIR
ncbi:TPA: hypothetical protein ACH3X2_003986 [Trebouxia sp. C0005]